MCAAQLLLANGLTLSVKDMHGDTPVDVAKRWKHTTMVQAFSSWSAGDQAKALQLLGCTATTTAPTAPTSHTASSAASASATPPPPRTASRTAAVWHLHTAVHVAWLAAQWQRTFTQPTHCLLLTQALAAENEALKAQLAAKSQQLDAATLYVRQLSVELGTRDAVSLCLIAATNSPGGGEHL